MHFSKSIILFLGILIGMSMAGTYFVDPNGLDTNNCTQINPCQTISHCLTLDNGGDIVTLFLLVHTVTKTVVPLL